MSVPPGWEGILDADERIVWQGRPGDGLHYEGNVATFVMGVFVSGFSIFWMTTAYMFSIHDGLSRALMPLFGLLFLYRGAGMAGGFALWDRYRRARTFYTLTDRRAFIARRLLGRKTLQSWSIDGFDQLEHEAGPPGNIWFATRKARKGKVEKIGFRHLDEAGQVYRMICDLRREPA